QTLFHKRTVRKQYEAIAPYDPELSLPRTVRSRIAKDAHVLAAQDVEGEPNAGTLAELAEHRDALGRYRLTPHTGRTHQLRLQLNGLGVPILGDDFYPVLTDKPVHEFTRPLQLLASVLEFTGPISGEHRRFETTR